MREAGENANEANPATEVLEIATIFNMGDTNASQCAAIESILKIKNRLEGNDVEEKEKAQALPPQKAATTGPTPRA